MAGQNAGLSFPVNDTLSCISFSPHESSSDLLAVGTPSKIAVKACNWTSDSDDLESGRGLLDVLCVDNVFSVLHPQPHLISWSPATSQEHAQFRFCASEKEKGSITIFSSTLTSTSIETLHGHKTLINDLCTHPSDETLLASVGDDCVCRLWDLRQSQLRSEFKLGSPGMSVKWHERDPVKLMVAESSGRVRFYDVSSDCPLLSLDCPTPPLISADWAPSNHLIVGGVGGTSGFLWDLSRSSQPLESKQLHKSAICKFGWCAQSEKIFSTLTAAGQLKIHHLAHQRVPVSCDLRVASDLSWHAQIPLVGVASDRAIKCWVVEI